MLQTGKAVKALLQAPLKSAGEVSGLLSADRQSITIPFSKQDEQLLAILADYVVIALERSQPADPAAAGPLP